MKRNRCEKLPSFLLRSEMKENRSEIFSLRCRKSVFPLVFASEAKRKWNEAKTKQKRSETKKSEAKRKIFGSETKWKYTILISHWSEAKRSKKIFFFARAYETHAKRISFHFEAKNFFLQNRLTLLYKNLWLFLIFSVEPLILNLRLKFRCCNAKS